MINRSTTTKEALVNIVGSSTFGRYPDISIEKTYNMFISDDWMVDYAGYKIAISASSLGNVGRALHASTKLNKLVAVVDDNVYLITITFDQIRQEVQFSQVVFVGQLQTLTGPVYITENNKPQIVISDGNLIYFYDPLLTPSFQVATKDGTNAISFLPGYVDFHDTYILAAASNDTFYNPPANNTWRLGIIDGASGKLIFPDDSPYIGLLQTKPDDTQAVVRAPSRGNMILVFGKTVTESWFDVGAQLFPYQRNNQYNIDYGCLNPRTIASLDEYLVWLAVNEKSGPTIMYTKGGMSQKISTDGIDYLFSTLNNPSDSEGFLYRQDGHLFYHINFYTDNISLYYDFNTDKFYHACDENNNYFIASSLAFINNQYYFLSRNNGNLYSFDTQFTTYNGAVIPRIRTCKNIRINNQSYFIANDIGFWIESGNTDYIQQNRGPIYLITQDGKKYITEGDDIFFTTEAGDPYITEDENNLVSQQVDPDSFEFLIAEQEDIVNITPRVDLSISTDGGETFSSYMENQLPEIGKRQNKLMWWNLGACNDLVPQFRFIGIGRFVASNGVVTIRQ